jgi:glycosyltransferase involved in cell wall biosynthesis
MKILIITDAWHPQVNGVVRTYEHLSAELEKLGHTVRVIGPAEFPVTIPMPSYPEIKLAVFPHLLLYKKIREFGPDTVHVATEGPLGWAGRRWCIRNKMPYTTTYHTHFPDYVAKRVAKALPFLYNPVKAFAKALVRHFHSTAKAMFVATQSLEDELKSWNWPTPMIRLIRGVKLEQFTPEKSDVFKDLKGPVAIYVGRVAIEKNLEAYLGMQWDGTKVVVGDGPAMDELKKKYPDAVFVGKKEGVELARQYQGADVFVFPSRTDTFGMVLIEALACGLPVAAYDVTGPRDIVTKPFLGVLDDDLAAAARKALSVGTREERATYTAQTYTWPHVAQQFLAAHTKH